MNICNPQKLPALSIRDPPFKYKKPLEYSPLMGVMIIRAALRAAPRPGEFNHAEAAACLTPNP
jgi:hypothetical protein